MAATVLGNIITLNATTETTDDILGGSGSRVDAVLGIFLAAGGDVQVDDALGNQIFLVAVPADQTIFIPQAKYTNGVGWGETASSTITVILK